MVWRDGMLIAQKRPTDTRSAEQAIDAMITAIHRGDYGVGRFKIESWHESAAGLFLGQHFVTVDEIRIEAKAP